MRDLFVGREVEQQAYQRLLTDESPWVMVVTGVGGCGKTALLRHLANQQTPSNICVGNLSNFHNKALRTDPLKVLEALASSIQRDCSSEQYEAFKNTLTQCRINLIPRIQYLSQNLNVGNYASSQGDELTMHVSEAIEEARRQVLPQATEALYAQIDTFTLPRVVIMLDACEWLSEPENQNVGPWLLGTLVPELHTHMQQNRRFCSFVIASRMRLQLQGIERDDIKYCPLPMLTEAEVYQYLEYKGMRDPELRKQIYAMTYGHADCVSIISEIWQERNGQPLSVEELQEIFYVRALESFVKEDILDDRLKSPFRELTRYGVLLRSFNLPLLQTVFQKLSPRLTIDNFYQFIRYPYIKPSVRQYYAFFELLRELQAQEIREQEPEEWKRYHQLAKDYFIQEPSKLTEWYYHALACNEEEAKQEAQTSGDLNVLKEAARDKTLKLAGTYE